MSRTIDPGKGSKRKVRQVRWTRAEMISVILLLLRVGGIEDTSVSHCGSWDTPSIKEVAIRTLPRP